jgi:hypothetical protein
MLHNNIINRNLEFKQLPNEQTSKVLKKDSNYLHLNIKQKIDFSKTMWNKRNYLIQMLR